MRSWGIWMLWAAGVAVAALAGWSLSSKAWFVIRGALATNTSGGHITGGLASGIPIAAAVAAALCFFVSRRGRRVLGGFSILCGIAMVVLGLTPKPPTLVEIEQAGSKNFSQVMTTEPTYFVVAGAVTVLFAAALALLPGVDRPSKRLQTDGWSVIPRGQDPTLP